MITSPNDPKQYHAFTLSNGLRVVAVHNPTSAKSAAALAVNVGHFDDPRDRHGMAHFLEHMLFLGTKNYPDGNEYHQFISNHGGQHNAWTATEHTCFFFDIQTPYFEEALHRFSDFFINPLLAQEFVEKERQNIDAEYKLKLKDDIRRLYDVHKATINQAHPFSQFSVGNTETLADRNGVSIAEEIKAFFEQHYSANLMTLAVESPLPLEESINLIEQHFSNIANKNITDKVIQQPLYLPEHLGIRIAVAPIKNERKLIVSFALPAIDQYYREKPENLLSYLIGHEGKGSLLSLLKTHSWVLGLTAGSGINGSNFKDFNINMSLTELGERHIDDIIALVFQYLQLIQANKLPSFYYEEKQALAKLAFQYQEALSPLDSVSQLVVNMQHYEPEHYIFGDYIMENMPTQSLSHLLQFFTTSNLRVLHISQANEFNQTTHWYKVPYNVAAIQPHTISKWQQNTVHPQLKLPNPNPYIVAEPEVFESQEQTLSPELIYQQQGFHFWFKQDHQFKIPKGNIYIGIDSPIVVQSIKHQVMTRIFVDLFSLSVAEKYYDAELAGIHYHLYSHQGGMTLQLSGISTYQPKLLGQLLLDLTTIKFERSAFVQVKNHLYEHWQNTSKSKSISQLFAKLSAIMQPNNPTAAEQAECLSTIEFAEFNRFYPAIFSAIYIEALMHGNWRKEDTSETIHSIKKYLVQPAKTTEKLDCPVTSFHNTGLNLAKITLPEHDEATIVYFPFANRNIKTTALCMLVSQLLSPIFFQKMRTEKQYGYLVGVGFVPVNRFPGLAFYIQSPNTSALDLASAIADFINNVIKQIAQFPEQHWQHLKTGLASQLTEKDTSLSVKSQRFWLALCNDDFAFCQKQKLIETIEQIQLADVVDFMKSNFDFKANPDCICLISSNQTITSPEKIPSMGTIANILS